MSLQTTCAGAAGTSLAWLLCTAAPAELIGVQPGFPQVFFDSTGSTQFDAQTGVLSVSATPVAVRFAAGEPPVLITPTGDPPARSFQIGVVVSMDGSLDGGIDGPDLEIVGEVDVDGDSVPEFDGVLLTGEVVQFGSLDTGPGGTVDLFDFIFEVTGGSMVPVGGGFDAAVVLTSEESSFAGDFSMDFGGEAKGVLGSIDGACCFPDGDCEDLSQDECAIAEGLFQGLGSTCAEAQCPEPTGACCVDGDCGITTQQQCAELGGLYQGDGVGCGEVDCPTPPGACCFEDGQCAVMPAGQCLDQGGLFQGEGTTCDEVECPAPEQACCLESGACAVVDPGLCLRFGGLPQGPGTDCIPNECLSPVGACCIRGDCTITTQDDCDRAGGLYQGDDTTCRPDPCG